MFSTFYTRQLEPFTLDLKTRRRRNQDVLWCWLPAMRRASQLSARLGVHRDMWDLQQNVISTRVEINRNKAGSRILVRRTFLS